MYNWTYHERVDESWEHVGGMNSLADLIVQHQKMVRVGIIESKNEQHQYYKVRDVEKNFTEWVPMMDVEIGEEVYAVVQQIV